MTHVAYHSNKTDDAARRVCLFFDFFAPQTPSLRISIGKVKQLEMIWVIGSFTKEPTLGWLGSRSRLFLASGEVFEAFDSNELLLFLKSVSTFLSISLVVHSFSSKFRLSSRRLEIVPCSRFRSASKLALLVFCKHDY